MKESSKKYLRWAVTQLILISVGLLAIELVLRLEGFKPGDMKPNWLNFKPVHSLKVKSDFVTTNEGILVADTNAMRVLNIAVNKTGFRTKEFSEIDSNKKKILFIGDSFTWGFSATPLDSCFTDLIRNETNYEVINLGVPVTDPRQYFALAQKYIPILKPDFVFVMFFTGNDLIPYDRKISAEEPIYFFTNAGAILADIDGKHFHKAQTAYNYYMNDKYYLRQPENIFESITSKSALLTRLYSVKFRIEEKLEFERLVKNPSVTKKYLTGIQQICSDNIVPLKFVLIPELKEADMDLNKYSERYAALLLNDSMRKDWLLLKNSKNNFLDYPDAHLNNKGHRFYADYLKLFLKNYFGDK